MFGEDVGSRADVCSSAIAELHGCNECRKCRSIFLPCIALIHAIRGVRAAAKLPMDGFTAFLDRHTPHPKIGETAQTGNCWACEVCPFSLTLRCYTSPVFGFYGNAILFGSKARKQAHSKLCNCFHNAVTELKSALENRACDRAMYILRPCQQCKARQQFLETLSKCAVQ